MKEEQDDLTLVYMYGFKKGRDSMRAENERLRAALRAIAAYDTDADGNWGFFRDEADAALKEASDD